VKPTIFRTEEEVKEAIDWGYIGCDVIDNHNQPAPLLVYKVDGSILVRSSKAFPWRLRGMTRLLRDSVEWTDIRHEYAKISFMEFLQEEGVLQQFLENCMLSSQRWTNIDEYYADIKELQGKGPGGWVTYAFNWAYQDDAIDWSIVSNKWRTLIKDGAAVWGEIPATTTSN